MIKLDSLLSAGLLHVRAGRPFSGGEWAGRPSFGCRMKPLRVIPRLLTLTMALLAARSGLALPIGGQYEVRQVKPNVFVWIPEDIIDQDGDPFFSRAGTAGFLVTPAGVLVVNTTNNPVHARELLFEIRQRSTAPVTEVIDTSAQGDQTLGNEVFADLRVPIIATSAATADMRSYQQEIQSRLVTDADLRRHMRGIHLTLPTESFDRQLEMKLGGDQVRLIAFAIGPEGKPSGDAAVLLPASKVLFMGDLFENGYVPQVESRDIRQWIAALRQVEKWDVEVYVPGHGNPGTRDDLVRFRMLLEWLQGQVQTGIAEGRSLSQVRSALLGSGKLYIHGSEWAPASIEAVYRQLSPPSMHATPSPQAKPAVARPLGSDLTGHF
jgi:cyclase